MSEDNSEISRILGRIEGILDSIREDFSTHKQEDQRNFSSVRILVRTQQKGVNEHLAKQNSKLDELKEDNDRAKGAGWVILGLLGAFATFAGGAVIALIAGWIKVKVGS